MNPYEETIQEMKRQSEGPKRFAKSAIGIGSAALGAAAFTPLLSRVAPFLSQYIPENLAIKGLSKISPKLGKFVNDALGSGYDFKEVKDFIGDQIKQSEPAKEDKNIIEKYSPELHQFIKERIAKGGKPIEAAAIAQHDKRFADIIKKLSKDHKTPWSSIIESIYGTGEQGGALPPRQEQAQQQPPQNAQGGLDPQVAQILQQGNEIMKRFKGQP